MWLQILYPNHRYVSIEEMVPHSPLLSDPDPGFVMLPARTLLLSPWAIATLRNIETSFQRNLISCVTLVSTVIVL